MPVQTPRSTPSSLTEPPGVPLPPRALQDDVQAFTLAWEVLDPYGTSYISFKQLTTLLCSVSARAQACVHVCEWVCACA